MIERACRLSGEKFIIERADLEFYAKMGVIDEEQLEKLTSLQVNGLTSVKAEKIPSELLIGLPTLCPTERWRRRLTFRNERKMSARKCDKTDKSIVSVYSQNVAFPVYDNRYWWSDNWDALEYRQDFDFSRPFFEQFAELSNKTPHIAIMNDNGVKSENCEYCYDFAFGKNCYLVVQSWYVEDGLYSVHCNQSKDFCDCSATQDNCELLYECVNCFGIYNSMFLQNCMNTSDSLFGLDLIGCKNCIGCVGLRNKEYYVFNKKYTKEAYEKFKSELETNKFSKLEFLRTAWKKHLVNFPRKYAEQKKCEDCFAHELFASKNAQHVFGSFRIEDSKFIFHADGVKNSYDASGGEVQWGLEIQTSDNSYMSRFTAWCWKSKEMWYSDNCHSCSDCFGCVGLKHKKYCILNKQYSKEEYEALVPKIIEHMKQTGEWGEFFPTSLSPFAYNETVAQEYFPLTKAEAEAKGYRWKEEKQTVQYTGPKYEIPDDIASVPDEIVTKVLQCERSGKFYRIQKAELKFYRKMNLPIPRLHPDERHKDRMKLRNPRKLWTRKCADCGCELQTTFAPDRPEKILCEECYLKVVD